MSNPSNIESIEKLSDTLSLTKYVETSGHKGYWLHDTTRGINLSMKAKTERDAFVEALTYYQKRLLEVEKNYKDMDDKVKNFVWQFIDKEEE